MADPTHLSDATGRLDLLRRGPAGAQVVEHRGTRVAPQQVARQQAGHQVRRDRLAPLVHEDRAVRVTIEADAEVGARALHRRADVAQVLPLERVGLVIREGTVGLEVETLDLQVEALQQGIQAHRRHAVAAVDGHAESWPSRGQPQDVLHVASAQVLLAEATPRAGRRSLGRRQALDLLQPARLTHRDRVLAADLEPVVLGWVVGGGEHDATVGAQSVDGVVEHRRADQPQVDHVRSLVPHALHQRREQIRGAAPRIPSQGESRRLQVLRGGSPDPPGQAGVELVGNHTADVVGLEDGHGFLRPGVKRCLGLEPPSS
jgi:hypothetical protein